MGCGTSSSIAHSDHSSEAPSPSAKWKEKLSKREARIKFMADGSIKQSSSDGLLELRMYLEDPVRLGKFGQYAKKCQYLNTLMCWSDILEFKSIDKKAEDFKLSKFNNIFCKYIQHPPIVKLKDVEISLEYEREIARYYSSANRVDGSTSNAGSSKDVDDMSPTITTNVSISTKTRPDILDQLMQECLAVLYDNIFIPFKSTGEYKKSERINASYNNVNLDDFMYMEAIGEGAYGMVIHAKKKSTGKHYAMKIQTKVGLLETFYDCPHRVIAERTAVASINHPYIISMDYAIQNTSMVMMLMDLGTGKFR